MSAPQPAPSSSSSPAAVLNPLREGLHEERIPEPATMVIFGASGDLTKRKLVPALYSLARDRLLPARFAVVGYARKPLTEPALRDELRAGCAEFARRRPVDPELWNTFANNVFYQEGSYDDPAAYAALKRRLEEIEAALGLPGNRVFYLSIPPTSFATVVEHLGASGLTTTAGDRFARVIIEKPFGTDLATAQALNRDVHKCLTEKQVYRIDHYLGKETVQNLLVFRFANGIFEPIWNNRFVDHVQITGAETVGVEGRGGYFESAGILRDMVQNHLFQVVSLASMEPPVSMDPDAVRDEKLKVLKALRSIPGSEMDAHVVRGQYTAGSIAGKKVPSYREEPGVSRTSQTESFVAMKFFIDSWRWAGVPFYLRSGKRLPKRVTEIAIFFKEAPHLLFGKKGEGIRPNVLAIRIQPDEGIALNFGSKLPGPAMEVAPVSMEFRYGSSFGVEPPEAYERLILDCLLGDNTLFTRADEVEASWAWITRIHEHWAEQAATGNVALVSYPAGTWAPDAAERLLAADHRAWRRP
ncbi:MAG TPA: glucose-6-phosphate dehydrogenase [Polyangia bacterium]|jgi:glucose-6-phosphate 1-dehydrogenase|nr:glucose-6-phosphate dehydrogenase [Polyangia bacterium]